MNSRLNDQGARLALVASPSDASSAPSAADTATTLNTVIKILRAPPGAGKTRAGIEKLRRTTWCIYAATTQELLEQTYQGFMAGSDPASPFGGVARYTVRVDDKNLHGHPTVGSALSDRSIFDSNLYVFVTHAGLAMIRPDMLTGADWTVVIDETPAFLHFEPLNTATATELSEVERLIELSPSPTNSNVQIAGLTAKGARYLNGGLQDAADACTARRGRGLDDDRVVKGRKELLGLARQGFRYDPKGQRIMTTMDPKLLRAAKDVIVLTADDSTNFFPEYLALHGFERDVLDGVFDQTVSCPNAQIFYAFDRGRKMASSQFLTAHATVSAIGAQLRRAMSVDTNSPLYNVKAHTDYFWCAHSKIRSQLEKWLPRRHFVSPTAVGLNGYRSCTLVFYFAATRLLPFEHGMLTTFIGDETRDKETLDARHMANMLQSVMRCALRVDQAASVKIVVTTRAEAALLAKVLGAPAPRPLTSRKLSQVAM